MSISDAWLLETNDSLSIAIGDHEMVEYVHAPVCFSVPGSPEYCNSVLFWQNNLVPVMDFGVLFDQPVVADSNLISLVVYQEEPGSPLQYVAIKVITAPEKIRVDDAQACELPDENIADLLKLLCLSCFSHEDQPVMILDINRLCSAEFRDIANGINQSPYQRPANIEEMDAI